MPDDLDPNVTDRLSATLKAGLGAVPFAGSLLVEITAAALPGQQMDRIVDYIRRLDRKLRAQYASIEALQARLESLEGARLLEAGARSAQESIGDQEREVIAGLVAKGLMGSPDDAEANTRVLSIIRGLTTSDIRLTQTPPNHTRARSPLEDLQIAHLAALGLLQANGMVSGGGLSQPYLRSPAGSLVLDRIVHGARL